jgi:hypothetical protein
MVSRLTELLERIRPAGSPGAPTEGERSQYRERRETELAALIRVLHEFEAEAAAVVSSAEARAVEIRRDADTEARRVRAGIPQLVAGAESARDQLDMPADVAERNRIAEQSTTEIERLHSAADERIPALVDAVVDLIWSSVAREPESAGRS